MDEKPQSTTIQFIGAAGERYELAPSLRGLHNGDRVSFQVSGSEVIVTVIRSLTGDEEVTRHRKVLMDWEDL